MTEHKRPHPAQASRRLVRRLERNPILHLVVNDEPAKALMKDLQVTDDTLRDLVSSVVSVKVEVVKPKR